MEHAIPELQRSHVRRISEPPQQQQQQQQYQQSDDVSSDFASGSDSSSSSIGFLNRRAYIERHWSANRLYGATNTSNNNTNSTSQTSASSREAVISNWQSWTTADASEVFGVVTPTIVRPDVGMPTRDFSNCNNTPLVDSTGLSSVIHDAARITDWDKVYTLCQSEPECAQYAGRDGLTALHHACNRRCPHAHVVEALIKAYPDALTKQVEYGWLPLHYACRFKAPKEVVRLLLQMYPEKGQITVNKRDRQGRTPLYYAVRYDAPPGVVGCLLQVDPSVVLEEDANGLSPLGLIWDSWAEKLEGKRALQPYLPMTTAMDVSSEFLEERASLLRARLQKNSNLFKRWKKVNLLLKAAFGFPVEDEEALACHTADSSSSVQNNTSNSSSSVLSKCNSVKLTVERKWRIVHATAAIKCHSSLFLLASALHPEQVRELDDNDLRRPGDAFCRSERAHQTALHLASSSSADGDNAKIVLECLLNLFPEAAGIADGIDGSLPLHRLVENERKQDWIRYGSMLYEANPRAVQTADRNGKLPLHRATAIIKPLEFTTPDAMERSTILQLLQAYPLATFRVDQNGCMPLHIIAQHSEVWDEQVRMIYETHPMAIQARAGESFERRLPLHLAAASPDSRESLLSRLSSAHPRAAAIADSDGKLPLHLACELGKEWDAGLNAIYSAFTNAVRTPEGNTRGWLPLHIAADAISTSTDTLAQLLSNYVDAAGVADKEGQFPLHLACRSGKLWTSGLEILFQAYPSAIRIPDSKGLVPLVIAALKYCQSSKEDGSKPDSSAKELDVLFNLYRADPTCIAF